MTARLALGIGAGLVLALGLYLFVEVRSTAASVTPTVLGATDQAAKPEAAAAPPSLVAMERPKWEGHPGGRGGMPGGLHHIAVRPTPSPDTTDGSAKDITPPDDGKPNPHGDAIMDQANKAYDRQDYDEAKTIAQKVLATEPRNVRMLRIVVSSSCIDGDSTMAQKYYVLLPKFDRDQMKLRCGRDYGVTLTDP
ncbi:MAG TPA: hypothetical protein VGF94_28690 [Kofleriaceae bacterium]